ncbi:MAG: methylenetetrahydrofolate reductase [SAR202 cluster bacterium]|nr:methylenetetrahydrofolate reductase [SAR202 cluster bacterium]MDP6715715.1 methylenetetrahydrofolate reductase [SAR202 cluster bacterium]
MSNLTELMNSKRFVVTAELNPPKGADLKSLFGHADALADSVDAFNITDSASSRMAMAPVGVAHLLLSRGITPILQVTGRDRNRIAIQADLLSAHALGITDLVCMTGDPPNAGDHPEAKAVFDLSGVAILQAITALQAGQDMMGNPLTGAPSFGVGAVVNPGAPDLDGEIQRMEQKIEAGAQFFQTQAVYEPDVFGEFMDAVRPFNVPVLAGLIMLKSASMARWLNSNLPGISVPDHLIQEMENADDRVQKSVEISARIIRDIKGLCAGVHIMPIGWESRIPRVLHTSGITAERGS